MHDFIIYIFRLLQRGIVWIIPVLLAGVVLLLAVWSIARKRNRPFPWKKVFASFLLVGWAGLTVFATLFRNEPGYRQWNFHLFLAWREAWNQFTLQVWLNVLLNIALFVPLGLLLPLLARVFRKWYGMLFAGFGLSMAIELSQLIFARGIWDVDDLFTNTLGAMLGWSIVMLILAVREKGIKQNKLCLVYLSIPAAFTFALAAIFIGYNIKPYGNLPDAPAIAAKLDSVAWELEITPADTPSIAPVYEAGRLGKDSAEQIGTEFAEKTGIVFEDTYYYDDMENTVINILVTLDENYIPYFNVMLSSLLYSNQGEYFNIYLLHSDVRKENLKEAERLLGNYGRLTEIQVRDISLENAPTSSRYPYEMYYRIFAAKYLPQNIDKIIYLDPDLIVNRLLRELYEMDIGENYFAAASHTGPVMQKINEMRLDMEEENLYINSGVLLMNLRLLRIEQRYEDVFELIEKKKNLLFLQDQDIISSLYGNRIFALDPYCYNMTERLYQKRVYFDKNFNLNWVRNHTTIIHYCGRNKPWKETYIGKLDVFYREARAYMERKLSNAVQINEIKV